ncbi:hypothetical protein [Streptomyces ardesiacus]|uniref:hypothetical protein n=1 Tax=Streptomyces ardesiacus TaxID=285564 RepID=UPI003654C7CD
MRSRRRHQGLRDAAAVVLGALALILVIGNAVAYYTAPCGWLKHMPAKSAPLRCIVEGK